MAEGEEGLPDLIEEEKKSKHYHPAIIKGVMNTFNIPWSKGNDKTPPSQSQACTNKDSGMELTNIQADTSLQTFPSRHLPEAVPGNGGRKSSKRDYGSKATPRKDSTTRNSQPYVVPPPSIPGQCEDDQQIHTKQYSSPLVSPMVDTQLRPMTVPVTVNTDRIVELEKLVHDGEVEKKLLKEMMDEKHREKVQLEEQLMNKEDEVEKQTKQLQVKTSEVASLEDKKAQLEQQLTHTVLVQKEEYDKELQDIQAERKRYKTLESHNTNLQVEIQQLKQELLSVKVSRQGITILQQQLRELQQQLRENNERIQGLTRASEEKTALVDESYRVLQESTEIVEKTSEQLAAKTKQCTELKQHLTRANEENKEIKGEEEKIVKSLKQESTQLQFRCDEKEQVVQELHQELVTLKIESREAQAQNHSLQGELSSLQQLMTDLKDVSEGKGKRIQQLSDLIDTEKKKLSELEEDLIVARKQNKVLQKEITKLVKEEKGARQVIARLQSELDKKKQALSKLGKKSLDELRRSYEELTEQTEEDRAITERQVRAYKRRVDELSEKLTEANDKTKQVQDRCDELIKVETERNELKGKSQEMLIRAESDSPSWLLDSSEVIVTDEKLGTGSYGTVQVALFRGTRVAAKCMHELILSDYNKELFVKEMNMSALLHHPNIVQFIGALVNAKNSILLYELMETSLYSYLQEGQVLPRPLVISIGCDVASALAYLHLHKPHPIIHRDVSSPNVLMESLSRGRWRCKLSDFGSARLQPHAKTKGPGNAYYSSHEVGDPANHTPAMDVYSFGVLLTEITLGRPPAPDTVSRERQANGIDWVLMKDLVLQCHMKDRLKRPKILTVIDSLRGLSF